MAAGRRRSRRGGASEGRGGNHLCCLLAGRAGHVHFGDLGRKISSFLDTTCCILSHPHSSGRARVRLARDPTREAEARRRA